MDPMCDIIDTNLVISSQTIICNTFLFYRFPNLASGQHFKTGIFLSLFNMQTYSTHTVCHISLFVADLIIKFDRLDNLSVWHANELAAQIS